jgi:hypothetical protein
MAQPTPRLTPRPAPRRVLEDETGRRLRRMRFLGRIVALLALCWLALVILGGLGVGPATHVPFGTAFRPSAGPPPLRQLPAPRQPAAADLVPALPAPVAAAAAVAPVTARGRSTSAPGHMRTVTTHGRSATAPGHTSTTVKPRGRSATAPGRLRHTTTTTTTAAVTTPLPGLRRGLGKKQH